MVVMKTLKSIPSERDEQIAFVKWIKLKGYRVVASANGGSRNLIEAVNLKRMGVSKGFPDIFVPLVSGNLSGFFVEMKRRSGGKATNEQKEWIDYLNENGYFAVVSYGCEEAINYFNYYITFKQ